MLLAESVLLAQPWLGILIFSGCIIAATFVGGGIMLLIYFEQEMLFKKDRHEKLYGKIKIDEDE